jgi:hypothetical protein
MIELTGADLQAINRIVSAHNGPMTREELESVYCAGLAAGLERAAKVCATTEVAGVKIIGKTEHYPGEYASECDIGYASGCEDCAAAIRALNAR